MSRYDDIADLPIKIDGIDLGRLETTLPSGMRRVTTLVRLRGAGEDGVGEDVTYDAPDHDDYPGSAAEPLDPPRRTSIEGFSRWLDGVGLFPARRPSQRAYLSYRRWAFESAALDLALRQAGTALAAALKVEPQAVRFVVSTRLPSPPSAAPLRAIGRAYPGTRFKLDPTSEWDDTVVREIAALDAVDVLDFKGRYRGTPVDQAPDAALYRRVAEAFPAAWLEDPALTPETDAALAPHRDRITWDAPIHGVEDVLALPFRPRMLNVKPSRFGSLRALMAFHDHCHAAGIGRYGGGQFELGPGRGQIQYLASLFHADAPNDVAPRGFNVDPTPSGLPASPLAPAPEPIGFRWDDGTPGGER